MRTTTRANPGLLLIAIAYLAFISLGLPDGLIGTAWPSMRRELALPIDALGILFISSTSGYLLSSASSGQLLAHMNVGVLLALSCLATALSLLGFALAPAWFLIIALGFLLGAGGGAIDAGLNAYAAIHFDPRTVNWLHACYGLGATTGPLLMTGVLSGGFSWRAGYLAVGLAQLILVVCFVLTRTLWDGSSSATERRKIPGLPIIATLRLPATWLGLLIFFLYTGLEVSAGQWAYSLLVEQRGVTPTRAGFWVSLYWGALTAGRVFFGAIAGAMSVARLLRGSMVLVICGVTLIWLGGASWIAAAGLALAGFALAPIFPSLIAETPGRLGERHTANAVGLQVALAAVGAAALPALVGVLARTGSLEVVGPTLVILGLVLFGLHETALRIKRPDG